MAFEIEEGVVTVNAEVNRTGIRAAAESAGREAGNSLESGIRKGVDESTRRNKGQYGGILRKAFTPNPDMFQALRAPFAAALSSPVGAAMITVAGVAAAAFVGAFATALATAGLGAVFLGIGIIALKENAKIQKSFETLGTRVKNAFAGAAGPLIAPLVTAMDMLGDAAERVAPLMRTIFAALAPAIPALTAGITGFVEEFLKILTADPATLQGMKDALVAIGANLPELGRLLGEVFAMFASNENNVRNIGILFNVLGFAITQLATGLMTLGFILDGLVIAWHAVQNAVTAAWQWITGVAVPGIIAAFNFLVGAGAGLIAWFQALPGRIMSFISSLPGRVRSIFVQMFDFVTTAIGVGIGRAVSLMISLPGRIVGAIASIPSRVASIFNSVRSLMSSIASSAVNAAVSVFRGLPGKAASAISGIRGRIQGVFAGAGGWLVSAGSAIVQGVARGIVGAMGGAIAAARRAAANIVAGFKSALKIGSPSRVMEDQVGRWIPAGIGVGIEANIKDVVKPLRELSTLPGRFANISLGGSTVGTDGASLGSPGGRTGGGLVLSVGTIQVTVTGSTTGDPRETGEVIANEIMSRLGGAALARGGRW